jgi:2-C-methyl-D-erythritol 4-phosphate cytidylyltransferase
VLIHDGARPLVGQDVIVRGIAEAHTTGAAVASVPVKDTIKVVDNQNLIIHTPDRGMLWAAQTPQVFRLDLVLEAYRHLSVDVTDDAQILELAHISVKVYMGSYDNIKITTPGDLDVAEMILCKRAGTLT